MDNKDLLNFRKLSDRLSGNETSVRRNSIPKTYQESVETLLKYVDAWDKGHELVTKQSLLKELEGQVQEKVDEAIQNLKEWRE